MTRLCAVCKGVLGEKCSRCGVEATPVEVNARGHALVGAEFVCPSSGYRFTQGDGGQTYGLCEQRLGVARRKTGAER